jgi:hypothetical protein
MEDGISFGSASTGEGNETEEPLQHPFLKPEDLSSDVGDGEGSFALLQQLYLKLELASSVGLEGIVFGAGELPQHPFLQMLEELSVRPEW